MVFINWLESCFSILFPCGLIISVIQGIRVVKNSPESVQTQNEKNQKADNLIILFNLVSMIIIIGLVFYLALKKGQTWLVSIFLIPSFLQYATGTFFSANVVGAIVRSKNTHGLSYREKSAIITLSAIFWIVEHQGDKTWLISQIDLIASAKLHDLGSFLYYAWKIYVYTFLNCALLSFLSQVFLRLLQKATQAIHCKWNQLMSFLYKQIDGSTRQYLFIQKHLEYVTCQKRKKQLLLWLAIPFVCMLDLVINIAVLLMSLVFSSLYRLLLLLQNIGRILVRPLEIFGGTSDRKIVVLSFRIAVISTLIAIVIINRYESIFKNAESSTAILEFIASAIIIPLVFEWISGLRTNNAKNKS